MKYLLRIFKKTYILIITCTLVVSSLLFSFSRIEFKENITSILPAEDSDRLLIELLDSASFFDRVIIHFHTPDSVDKMPNTLVHAAQIFIDSMLAGHSARHIQNIEGKISPGLQDEIYNAFFEAAPLYFDPDDYKRIDSVLNKSSLHSMLMEHIKVLNSPAGFMASKYLFRDPLGLINTKLKRLSDLQIDNNLQIYQNFLLTKDKRHLVLFVTPDKNLLASEQLELTNAIQINLDQLQQSGPSPIIAEQFGSIPISNANASQIKRDAKLTISIAVVIIGLLFIYFFRRLHFIWLIFLPSIIGATVALLYFAIFQPTVSSISLGIGSVLLGITVDYALHILTHLKHHSDYKKIIRDVAIPVLTSSFTTAMAFICLLFISSPAIRQLGLFSAISVITAAIASIFLLPLILKTSEIKYTAQNNTIIEKLAGVSLGSTKIKIISILGLTLFLGAFSGNVKFEDDIGKVNFMSEQLKNAEQNLAKAKLFSDRKSYLLSEGNELNASLVAMQNLLPKLDSLEQATSINRYNAINNLVFPVHLQNEKLKAWNEYWTKARVDKFKNMVAEAAKTTGLKAEAYTPFIKLISRKFSDLNPETTFNKFSSILNGFRIQSSGKNYVVSVIHLEDSLRSSVNQVFQGDSKNHIIDQKLFFIRMFDLIKKDFNLLVMISLGVVFFIILAFLGRIELALVTFIPILISWVWTLGLIRLWGIKLNFFNIVICSLIFGLGIDYAIFVTKGLMHKYRTGENSIISFKSSIIISATTTVVGLGVLLLAKHPAMRSIAGLAIIGICSSLFISFTLQPILFRYLAGRFSSDKQHIKPITIASALGTIFTFGLFGVGSVILTFLLPLVYLIPLKAARRKYLLRNVVGQLCKTVLSAGLVVKFKKINIQKANFNTPGVIVSNHQSMIDILFYLGLSPKLIILTKDWVWKNPVFGFLVRASGHLTVSVGQEKLFEQVKETIAEGNSVLVFPEGSRTSNGAIKRFHKGGFLLAEELKLPIRKFLILGASEVLPKGAFLLRRGTILIQYLGEVLFNNAEIGKYREVSKATCRTMREDFSSIRINQLAKLNAKSDLMSDFLYKGPVLEHYVRVKLAMENNYDSIHRLIPAKCKVVDMGCGYGYLPLMLGLLNPERQIKAYDYDKEKIITARHTLLSKKLGVEFEEADFKDVELPNADVFLLSDSLHYLPRPVQQELISSCSEKLNGKGKIIIRDADSSLNKRHKFTQFIEFVSTNFGFNKTECELDFFDGNFIKQIAAYNGLNFEIKDMSQSTSNVLYILSKN